MGKPQKTRSEVEDMVLEKLKGSHPALEMVLLHDDRDKGWQCRFVWKIGSHLVWNTEGKIPVDDVGTLRSQADVAVAKVRERFEITED
jgi:hypothetical protein